MKITRKDIVVFMVLLALVFMIYQTKTNAQGIYGSSPFNAQPIQVITPVGYPVATINVYSTLPPVPRAGGNITITNGINVLRSVSTPKATQLEFSSMYNQLVNKYNPEYSKLNRVKNQSLESLTRKYVLKDYN